MKLKLYFQFCCRSGLENDTDRSNGCGQCMDWGKATVAKSIADFARSGRASDGFLAYYTSCLPERLSVLNYAHPRNIEIAAHIDEHPGDHAPTGDGGEDYACDQSIKAKQELHPNQGADRGDVGAVNCFALFPDVIEI